MVEDGYRILEEAAEKTVVLASYGDPMVATTHTELRVRAVQSGIPVRVAHGPSAITSMIGECGLHHYMVGRMATIMEEDHLLETPYMVSYRNAVLGYHTPLLLEYNQDANFFLDAGSALKRLQGAEGGQRRGVFAPDRYCMGGVPRGIWRAGDHIRQDVQFGRMRLWGAAPLDNTCRQAALYRGRRHTRPHQMRRCAAPPTIQSRAYRSR